MTSDSNVARTTTTLLWAMNGTIDERPFHRSNVRSCTQLLLDTGQNTIPLATLILFIPIFHYIDSLSRVLPTWSSPFSPVKSFQRGTGRFCFDHRRVRNDKLTRLTLSQMAGVNLMRQCLWHYPDINVERSTTLFFPWSRARYQLCTSFSPCPSLLSAQFLRRSSHVVYRG